MEAIPSLRRLLLLVTVLLLPHAAVDGYRPVVLMHGVLSSAEELQQMVSWIASAHNGTQTLIVDAYNDMASLDTAMWEQVDGVHEKIESFMSAAEDGVNMICFSQGGLVCRGILEKYPHNVHTFIALSSPLAGQFGVTDYIRPFLPGFLKNITREDIYMFFYESEFQKYLSIADYWNDPHHQAEFEAKNTFLPPLNNGTGTAYKSNFLKLEQLVLIGGEDDGVITPWQSSHFGFYDASEDVLPMKQQSFYVNDCFGLRTLAEAGKIQTYDVPGVEHIHWHTNETVFRVYIEPWLD